MNTYHIIYTYNGWAKEFAHYCSTPIAALNEFHRKLQKTRELDAKRKVVRPKLGPNDYKITRMFTRNYGFEGETIESEFDLPKTPNPNLNKMRATRPQQTTLFPD